MKKIKVFEYRTVRQTHVYEIPVDDDFPDNDLSTSITPENYDHIYDKIGWEDGVLTEETIDESSINWRLVPE